MTRNDAGFTLVEMTMALAITATVAVAAMAALDQLTDADARVTQHIESTVGVYRALQTVRRDVTDAIDVAVTSSQLTLKRADGSVVVYWILGGGTELHRATYASSLLVPLVVVDLLTPVQYGPRGHIRDGDYRASALVQGALDVSFTAVTGPRTGTTTGVKVRIYHSTSHGKQFADAVALSLPLVETDAKR